MRGRKPIPAQLIDIKVHKTKEDELNRRLSVEEKLMVSSVLEPPEFLTPVALEEWNRVLNLYQEMEINILSDLDRQALIIYCEAVSIYRKAHEVWSEHQQVVDTDDDAQKIIDKTFKTMQTQSQIISKYSEQLALTPVGRARMGVAKKEEPTKFEKFLMGDE